MTIPGSAENYEEDPRVIAGRREVFWQNVMREILSALAVAAGSGGRLSPTAGGAAQSAGPIDELFDGRIAIITTLGQRIPIADIYPVFACSVPGSARSRMLSGDVQCTVYQIRTPTGEMFTLPLSQIRSFHSLSEELVRRLEAAAVEGDEEDEDERKPFGFAAFTSLARSTPQEGDVSTGSDQGPSQG
ncbi:MAG: hypothetical protein R3B57_13250 [Phycisphaerales bacterium]